MITRAQLLAFIKANPDAESAKVAAAFNLTPAQGATRLKQLLDGGFVTRKEVRRLATGGPVYGYRPNVAVEPAMNKKERVATVPSNERTVGVPYNDDMTSMVQSLSKALASQIAAQVVVSLQSQLQQQLAAVIPPMAALPSVSSMASMIPDFDDAVPVIHEPATYKTPSRPKLRKIGIVGLLPQQAGIISSEFGDAFDLHFWKDDGQNRLKSMAIGCEIILVTKWAAHMATDTINSAGGKWKKVHGSIEDLRTILTEMFVKEAA